MSKLSSEAQRNPSEEESSGSDAESEVSLEPETDRFGFILTNGSTAGSVGPPPELVRQREAKWINIIGQWDRILLKKSSKVKLQCQKGIPASLRAKCWPLLCGATDQMRQNKNLYESLDSQPGLPSWVDIIERDLDRQFPFHEMFLSKDGHGQQGLFRVLKAYTQFQPKEGYCQAQGPVAAVLLMNMPTEEAFWCLVQISEQYLPGYYSPSLEGVMFDATILTWVLKKMCPAVHKHLQQHGVEPLMFATDWLMCLFTRHLPFNTLLRVWDLFFCYGVRVLLQVAVVLVRRVLGRTEQRKKCQGQMETLEKLRGVKEQVQDDDDAFIAEVCSVPLSKKDLEKRMEKELEKWRKDRPSSTFDPKSRCHGYQMAWAKARQNKEEQERKEREKGNLSVPLARSASTLSLSPSLLHKRWKKGGKVNTGDSESSNRVVRHRSMGGKEDWKSWADVDFRKEQDVQEEEDDVQEGQKTKTESKVNKKEQQEHLAEPKGKNTPTVHKEVITVEEQTEQLEASTSTEEESRISSEQKERSPASDQGAENVFLPKEVSSDCEQEEKLDDVNQLHILEEQSPKSNEKDSEEGTENPEGENENMSVVKDSNTETEREDTTDASTESREEPIEQADVKPEEGTETEHTPKEKVDTVTEVSDIGSETNLDPDAVKDQELKAALQEEEAIRDTKEDASEEKHQRTESLTETEEEETHAQITTENDVLGESVAVSDVKEPEPEQHTDKETEAKTEEETLTSSSTECVQQNEDTDTKSEAEEEAAQFNTTEETVQETGETVEQVHLEPFSEENICDQTKAEETEIVVQTNEEGVDCVIPAEEEETSTQDEALNDTPEPDQKNSEDVTASETQAPEETASPVTTQDVDSTEKVQENKSGEDDVFISTEPTVTDSNAQIQDSPSPKPENSSPERSSARRSSRSSGDYCVRKFSSSHGSKLTRRLSEDLFISPEKTSQFSPSHPEAQPDAPLTAEETEGVTAQCEQQPDSSKRFGLFRKLKGEQPRNAKAKKKPKMQVPKILIQDFSNMKDAGKLAEEEGEEKLSSRERRRRRREQERNEKEEEKLRKKKEKELERERRKPQTRGKSFQEKEKVSDAAHPAKTHRFSFSHAESYF